MTQKTPKENVLNTLCRKKVLFLENDNVLRNGIDEFHSILQRGGIEHTVLFNFSQLTYSAIYSAVCCHDVVVFQTYFTTEPYRQLFNLLKSVPDKKIVVECYIYEPTWEFASQHKMHHDVFIYSYLGILSLGKILSENEIFCKLTDEPFWDYENGFDK